MKIQKHLLYNITFKFILTLNSDASIIFRKINLFLMFFHRLNRKEENSIK